MKYERPELLIFVLNMEDVIVCSTQENWGTGGDNDDDDVNMDQFT